MECNPKSLSPMERNIIPCAGAVLSLAQTHRGRPQTTSTRLYAGGELQGSPVCTPAACSFPGENARSWEALGEARPGQSSLSAGARRYRAWVQSWSPSSPWGGGSRGLGSGIHSLHLCAHLSLQRSPPPTGWTAYLGTWALGTTPCPLGQGASRAAPGKSGLHARGEGERVLAWQFAHPRPLSLLQRGLAPRSKGKARAELRPARRQARLPHSRSLAYSPHLYIEGI